MPTPAAKPPAGPSAGCRGRDRSRSRRRAAAAPTRLSLIGTLLAAWPWSASWAQTKPPAGDDARQPIVV
jgi:hypothetical protein